MHSHPCNPVRPLPDYFMAAGETQKITVMLFTENNKQIDAYGMITRLTISDYINRDSEPLVVKSGEIIKPTGADVSSIFFKLLPADTRMLRGQFYYQVAVRDINDDVAILKGNMIIDENTNKTALL